MPAHLASTKTRTTAMFASSGSARTKSDRPLRYSAYPSSSGSRRPCEVASGECSGMVRPRPVRGCYDFPVDHQLGAHHVQMNDPGHPSLPLLLADVQMHHLHRVHSLGLDRILRAPPPPAPSRANPQTTVEWSNFSSRPIAPMYPWASSLDIAVALTTPCHQKAFPPAHIPRPIRLDHWGLRHRELCSSSVAEHQAGARIAKTPQNALMMSVMFAMVVIAKPRKRANSAASIRGVAAGGTVTKTTGIRSVAFGYSRLWPAQTR
jgi:hypothetical protein